MSDQLVSQASDNTEHCQETNIHTPGGIRTHNPRKRAASDPRLRPRGHWDRHETYIVTFFKLENTFVILSS
jgi:hypothetical protein